MDQPDTVFILQGNKDVGPALWKAKAYRTSANQAQAVARKAGVRDPTRHAVLSLIVRDMEDAGADAERKKHETRLRVAVMKMRTTLHGMLQSVQLPDLPIIVEAEHGQLEGRGEVAALLKKRLKAVASAAQQQQEQQEQRAGPPGLLPRAEKRVRVSQGGREGGIGPRGSRSHHDEHEPIPMVGVRAETGSGCIAHRWGPV